MLFFLVSIVLCTINLASSGPIITTASRASRIKRLQNSHTTLPSLAGALANSGLSGDSSTPNGPVGSNSGSVPTNVSADALGYNNLTSANIWQPPPGFLTESQLGVILGAVEGSPLKLGSLHDIPPPLPNNSTFSSVSGEIAYPNPTNLSVIVNPANDSVSDLLPDSLISKRSTPLLSRKETDNILLDNGMYLGLTMGGPVGTAIFEAAIAGLWQQIQHFTLNNDWIRTSWDFWYQIHRGEAVQMWDYYVWLPGRDAAPVHRDVLELAFQALFQILKYEGGGDVLRMAPLIAKSFQVYAADGRTPVMLGYLKPTNWRLG